MNPVSLSRASAPPPIRLQATRVRRRISASDSVATLVASMAFGSVQRDHDMMLNSITADRCGAAAGVRS